MQKKQGISLIVLVITIIVMVILAGAIVLTLNNNGIISKASEAVDKTNLANVKELAQTGWAEAYASGARNQIDLQKAVDDVLIANKIDKDEYGVYATTSGVIVGWIQDGLTVKKGNTVLKIGDDYEYDEGEVPAGYADVTWKVLGASENGELLIMSAGDVTKHEIGSKVVTDDKTEKLKSAQNSWLNGPTELDEICKSYGKGKGATGARSIRIDDIDKITGFDKTTYAKERLFKYGNKVTYTYNVDTKQVDYTSTSGLKGTSSKVHDSGFHYYDGTNFITSTTTAELTSNMYRYEVSSGDFELTEEVLLMIIGEYDEDVGEYSNRYWLANTMILTQPSYAQFCSGCVYNGDARSFSIWLSEGSIQNVTLGVRAVVSLAANIQVKGSSETGWTY